MKIYLTPQCGEPRELGEVQTLADARKIVEDLDKQWDVFWTSGVDFDSLPEDDILRCYEGSDIEVHDGTTIWWLADNEWMRSDTGECIPW